MVSGDPTVFAHVSVGVNDLFRSAEFYDALLETLDIYREFEIPNVTIAYGTQCEFWIGLPDNVECKAIPGNGVHIAFNAKSRASVDSFYRIALENDGQGAGDPGL